MNDPRISYGTIKVDGQIDNDRIHHLFDFGLTGAGIGPRGHSERTICGKYQSQYFHIYMQAIPFGMADLMFVEDEKYCPECLARFKHYIDEQVTEDDADGSPE